MASCIPPRTFAELHRALAVQFPAAADSDHVQLLQVASDVARYFPAVELWDHIGGVLEHSMRKYHPEKGPFLPLFRDNLKERFRRETARQGEEDKRRKQAEGVASGRRHSRQDEVNRVWRRWACRLLDLGLGRLDEQTRACFRLKWSGAADKDIASQLGISANELQNRYGGPKLAQKVQRAVRRVVRGLPAEHLRFLVQHLQEHVGFSPATVAGLLGVTIGIDEAVPVLGEETLLETLGWADDEQAAPGHALAG